MCCICMRQFSHFSLLGNSATHKLKVSYLSAARNFFTFLCCIFRLNVLVYKRVCMEKITSQHDTLCRQTFFVVVYFKMCFVAISHHMTAKLQQNNEEIEMKKLQSGKAKQNEKATELT